MYQFGTLFPSASERVTFLMRAWIGEFETSCETVYFAAEDFRAGISADGPFFPSRGYENMVAWKDDSKCDKPEVKRQSLFAHDSK